MLLRIEDTDRERSTEAAITAIIDGLTWLGLEWDGDVVYQFARATRHREMATELLARAIGPTGRVFGQSRPRPAGQPSPAPAAPEGNANPSATPAATPAAPPAAPRPSPVALAERDKALQGKAAPIVAVVQPFEEPVPADFTDARLDLVTLMFNYHDLGFMGVDRARMNAALFRALKSGGIYVIADHAGRPGTRKSKRRDSSSPPKAPSLAIPTTRRTRTLPTRPSPRTSS